MKKIISFFFNEKSKRKEVVKPQKSDEFSSYLYRYTPDQKLRIVRNAVSKSSQDQRDLVKEFGQTFKQN